jgi:hypothetical protein
MEAILVALAEGELDMFALRLGRARTACAPARRHQLPLLLEQLLVQTLQVAIPHLQLLAAAARLD